MKKRSTRRQGLKKEWKNIVFNCVFALLSLLVVLFFYNMIWLTTLLLFVIALAGLYKWKSLTTVIVFAFGALWGPVSEMIAIYAGAWEYAFFNVWNVPIWLFVLWGDAAAFLYQTGVELKKLGVRT